MDPIETGQKYDQIASWWHKQHLDSDYGVEQLKRTLAFAPSSGGKALDVGCGAGGRLITLLQDKCFSVLGIDVSSKMLELAKEQHPKARFIHQDIVSWESDETFDVIIAWDSLFHLPFHQHEPVITKICQHLRDEGVLMYTFGDAYGEHTDRWHEDTFYYSSIGINENITLLMRNGLTIQHMALDQHPANHVYVIACRRP